MTAGVRTLCVRCAVAGVVLGLFGISCGPKTVPAGTPPPEYERREFPPWPEGGVDSANGTEAFGPDFDNLPLAPGEPGAEPRDAGLDSFPADAGVPLRVQ